MIQRVVHKMIFTGICAFAAVCIPASAQAGSNLYITPANNEYNIEEVFEVELFMASTDKPINAVAAHVFYDPQALELLSYRRTSERVSFWIEQESDPSDGLIAIEGLLIDKGWQGEEEKLAHFTFRTKQPGATKIGIDRAALHVYDGTGRNVVEKVSHSIVNINNAQARDDYKYIGTGFTDVDGRLEKDILYDDSYVREYRLVHLMPWWAWMILLLAVVLFIYSWRTQAKMRKLGIVFSSQKERDQVMHQIRKALE